MWFARPSYVCRPRNQGDLDASVGVPMAALPPPTLFQAAVWRGDSVDLRPGAGEPGLDWADSRWQFLGSTSVAVAVRILGRTNTSDSVRWCAAFLYLRQLQAPTRRIDRWRGVVGCHVLRGLSRYPIQFGSSSVDAVS